MRQSDAPPRADLAGWIIGHRKGIGLAWLVLAPALFIASGQLQHRMASANRLEGSESARAEDALAERFQSPFAHSLLGVVRGLPPIGEPAGQEAVGWIEAELLATGGVQGVLAPSSPTGDPLLAGSEPGSAVFVVGYDAAAVSGDSIVRALRGLGERVGAADPQLTVRWTGVAALSRDLRQTSSGSAREAELRALPLVLVLLLLAFRSLVAALIPIVFGFLAIGVATGAALLLTLAGTPSLLLGNVISILGLALGIDYSLLTVTRFREALASGLSSREAAEEAVRGAGRTIVLSGSTVMVGFAGLLLIPVGELQSVGLGGLVVAVAAVALGTTLLPALLAWLGRRIDWIALGARPAQGPSRRWMAWGRLVTAHPWKVLIVTTVPVALISLPALRLSPMTPQEDWLPRGMESARALEDLTAIQRSGLPNTLRIVLKSDSVSTAPERWATLDALTDSLGRDPRIATVNSLPAIARDRRVPPALLIRMLPTSVRRYYQTDDGRWSRIDVVPRSNVPAAELSALVRDLRAMDDVAGRVDAADARVLVGGIPAFQTDYEDAVGGAVGTVVGIVVLSTLLVLSIGFRSVVIPIKATVLNLLTVGAGLGALVLVFQDGFGSQWMGVDSPLSGVFPAVPIMAFSIVFGLSMDYEVFLVGRIAQLRAAHPDRSEREVIVEGLASTARVITFAAALMVVIFAAFAVGEYLPSQLFGFALAVAVATDATLVRLAIGPALLQLAGRWNWWPGDAPGIRPSATGE